MVIPTYACILLKCKVVVGDNRAIKEMYLEDPIVKRQHQTSDNPIFVVFYLANAHAVIADFSGNPPQATTL